MTTGTAVEKLGCRKIVADVAGEQQLAFDEHLVEFAMKSTQNQALLRTADSGIPLSAFDLVIAQ